jgi:hypothetical protein
MPKKKLLGLTVEICAVYLLSIWEMVCAYLVSMLSVFKILIIVWGRTTFVVSQFPLIMVTCHMQIIMCYNSNKNLLE